MRSVRFVTAVLAAALFTVDTAAEEIDYYENLRFYPELRPDVGRDQVDQDGGPDATGYRRRTVRWWPRKGQDIVDVPEGTPLRTWTRNKGQHDKEALAGLCRNWTESDPETFEAHLVGFRGFGVPTPNPTFSDEVMIPAAILRLEDGRQKAVVHFEPLSKMLCAEDHAFILKTWKAAWPKVQASVSDAPYITNPRDTASFPDDDPGCLVIESPHWRFQTGSTTWVDDFYLISPDEPEKQARYRQGTLEFAESLWTYVEAAGARMPFWREHGPDYKFCATTGPGARRGWERFDPGNGGGYGCCTLYWCGGGPRNVKLSHEFFHSGYHGENGCNAGQHMLIPGELPMFSHNFCYPWRNVMFAEYQAGLWMTALGENPNFGHGIVAVLGSLRSDAEPTLYHAAARLGQRKGLWANGIKGLGDFFGEYAARMVTVDFIEQPMLRCKYGMPEVSYLRPVYGRPSTYRIPNAEEPRAYGFNIVRLVPDEGAKGITVVFHGFYEPADHSDWRACIVAVDGEGRARYSPMFNRGKMSLRLKPSDKHVWLTVAATPSALPVREGAGWHGSMNVYYRGNHTPRFPWEVTLAGCTPGSPHRRQGDVVNLDELYTINNENFYVDHAVKHEVPIRGWEADATLAKEKLAAMLPRIEAAEEAVQARLDAGEGHDEYWLKDWYEYRKLERLEDLRQRVEFLQRNTKGRRHENGGGFVAENAHADPTAYVGPDAMVLDGARVEGNACIKQHAVVIGPRTVVSGNAKIGGKAWLFGDVTIDGNARVLESVVLATRYRRRGGYHVHSDTFEGAANVTGNAVLKGEHIMQLCYARDQVLTGSLAVDYNAKIASRHGGVFDRGRFCRAGPYNWAYTPAASLGHGLIGGFDDGGLYVNWQFDQPKRCLMEDAYVNNNGVLHGEPDFIDDDGHKCVAFNGVDQYAEAPPSVADFGELTIDARIKWSGGRDQVLFAFGTNIDARFFLRLADKSGGPSLFAWHGERNVELRSPEALPANRWVDLRVTMNGSQAAIYFNGKCAAKGEFPFRPRDVFVGDEAEGNSIGCFINCDGHPAWLFKGRIDHFRIYRQVHDDFDVIGQVPLALTQVLSEETCRRAAEPLDEKYTELADQWRERRDAKQRELSQQPDPNQPDVDPEELNRRRSQLLNESDLLTELNQKRSTLHTAKSELDRKAREKFELLAETVEANERIAQTRQTIERIRREIRETDEYTEAAEAVRAAERRLGEIERHVRESARFKVLEEAARAADVERNEAEEAVRQLPEVRKAREAYEQEEDRPKKDELRRKYESLLGAQRSSDENFQNAETNRRESWDRYHRSLREVLDVHPQRTKTREEIDALRKALTDLERKLKADRPELTESEAALKQRQQDLDEARRAFMARQPGSGEWKDDFRRVLGELEAVDRAIAEEKRRLQRDNVDELAEIGRIFHERAQRAKFWRLDGQGLALQETGLAQDPFARHVDRSVRTFQQSLGFRTSADWEYRTRQEINDDVTPIMKTWLERVRGY